MRPALRQVFEVRKLQTKRRPARTSQAVGAENRSGVAEVNPNCTSARATTVSGFERPSNPNVHIARRSRVTMNA